MELDAAVSFPTSTELEDGVSDDTIKQLVELYEDLDASHLQPLWTQNTQLMGLEPAPRAIPWLWEKSTVWDMAERTAHLITITRGGDRRVLALANPGLGGTPFATPTLWGAIQYLNAHESAPGHRHTPAAVRFVMEGEGTWTTVDGDAIDMHEGDLILTPPWHWHDHSNASDRRMVWFDGLDLPLIKYLDAVFFEQYPVEDLQPVKGRNISERMFGGRGVVPRGSGPVDSPYSPLQVYRYTDTDAALAALLEERGGPMVALEYVNPLTGGAALPTFGCEMIRIRPGERTAPTRRVGSCVYVVYRGQGSSIIAGQRFDWAAGDMFAVPSWSMIDHQVAEDSDLFMITDAPVLKALGLYREETADSPQQITSTFTAGQ